MTQTKILIVEDEAIIALNLQGMLEALGYEVPAPCSSGEAAIELAAALQPDLVLMDIDLKGKMDGIQAAEHIREQLDIPVVYLTGYSEETVLQEARNTWPYGYLIKPIDGRALRPNIEMAIDRHKVEQALRESEERYRKLIETIPHGIEKNDLSGIITLSNAAHHKMLGYTEGDLLGKAIWDLLASNSERDELRDYLAMLLRDQPSLTPFVTKNRTKDGRVIDVQVDWDYERDDQGRVTGFVSIITDITERKKAEEALRESEKKYRILVENSPTGIFTSDAERFIYVNPRLCEITGYSRDELLNMLNPVESLMVPEERERVMAHALARISGGKAPISYEVHGIRKDGDDAWLNLYVSAIELAGRRVLQGTVEDITERVRVEEALRESEMINRSLLEGSPVCNKIIDLDYKLRYMSAAGLKQLKIPDIKPYYGQTYPPKFYPESMRATLLKKLKLAMAGKITTVEAPVHDMEGNEVWYHTTYVPAFDDDGRVKYVIDSSVDITERKRAEEALRESENSLKEAQRIANMGSWIWDLKTNAVAWTDNLCLMHGMKPGEFDGQFDTVLIPTPQPLISISITDTGCGIPEENISKLFEPLFSTKARGIGLGLAISKNLVEANGGTIEVQSQEGKGTTFTLNLPLNEE